MSCRGICQRLKALDRRKVRMGDGQGRYESGQLRCTVCEIFIFTNHDEGNLCPCCKSKLRTRPKGMKFKQRFRSRISTLHNHEVGNLSNVSLA